MEAEAKDYFDKLPNEVFQLIFAAVSDCKSLVRCMVVSRAFREQSARVSSLSIICPGQFSSYDQKLRGIYTMVKEFQALESLVVRVGQPKDEPPSWARCMRYAEIGASVEKFVFMAAKSGDFSEFDCALGGPQTVGSRSTDVDRDIESCETQERVVDPGLLVNNEIAFLPQDDESSSLESSARSPEPDPRETRGTGHVSDVGGESISPGIFKFRATDSQEASSSTLFQTLADSSGQGSSQGETSLELERQETGENSATENPVRGVLDQRNLSPTLEQGPESRRLPDFNLRQVIAPSNDVLKRMVPVIVFAIVQGLDEFRDSVPAFVSRFPGLKRFLLVDMVESVTVHMREHQIQEIRVQRLREKEGVGNRKLGIEKEMKREAGGMIQFGKKKNSKKGDSKGEKLTVGGVKFSGDEQEGLDQWAEREEMKLRQSKGKSSDQDSEYIKKRSVARENAEEEVEGTTMIPKSGPSPDTRAQARNMSNRSAWETPERSPSSELTNPNEEGGSLSTSDPTVTNALPPCQNCEKLRIAGITGMCWYCLPKCPSLDRGSFQTQTSPVREEGGSSYENLIGKWSCDSSLKGWLSGRQRLAGPEERPSEDSQRVSVLDGDIKTPAVRLRTFDEIMACRLRDEVGKQTLKLPYLQGLEGSSSRIPESSESSEQSPEQSSPLGPHVTFSDEVAGPSVATEGSSSSRGLRGSLKNPSGSSRSGEDNVWESPKARLDSVNQVGDNKIVQARSGSPGGEDDFWQRPKAVEHSGSSDSLESLKADTAYTQPRHYGKEHPRHEEEEQHSKGAESLKHSRDETDNVSRKGKGIKERYKGRNSRFWGRRRNSVRDGTTRLVGKYSFKRALRADALKRREGDRASRIVSFRNQDRSRHQKDERRRGEWRSTKGEKVVRDESSGAGLYFIGGGAHELIGETEAAVAVTPVLTDELLKELKGKQALASGFSDPEQTSSEESLRVHCSPERCSSTDHADTQSVEGVVTVPYSRTPETTGKRLQGFGELGNMDLQLPGSEPERGRERLGRGEEGHLGWARRRDRSVEQLRSAVDLQAERKRFEQSESAQLGMLGMEERSTDRDTWRETWRERVGRRVREIQRETASQGESEREREARRERLREGVRKRQRDIEREALFFDISFWRAEQIITQTYCLSDVSMCIATHSAKPLTDLELNILSVAALAGPLLSATVAHVNRQVGSHNL